MPTRGRSSAAWFRALTSPPEVSGHLVGSTAFKAAETGDPRLAGSIPVHLRQQHAGQRLFRSAKLPQWSQNGHGGNEIHLGGVGQSLYFRLISLGNGAILEPCELPRHPCCRSSGHGSKGSFLGSSWSTRLAHGPSTSSRNELLIRIRRSPRKYGDCRRSRWFGSTPSAERSCCLPTSPIRMYVRSRSWC